MMTILKDFSCTLMAALALMGISSMSMHSSSIVDAFVVPNSAHRTFTSTSSSRLFASTTIDTLSSIPIYDSGTRSDEVKEGSAQDVKVGVLLLNLGGPEKTEDVEGTLRVCTFTTFTCHAITMVLLQSLYKLLCMRIFKQYSMFMVPFFISTNAMFSLHSIVTRP